MKKKVTLLTGGSRSGKSSYALKLANEFTNKVFVATATAFDDEMTNRINKHQADRGDSFTTIEEPIEITAAIRSMPSDTDVAIIDCLTVWLGNLMHRHESDTSTMPEIDELLNILIDPPINLIIVTNEVGSGIIPENAMAREFRDLAGALNQKVAELADSLVLSVCGHQITIK